MRRQNREKEIMSTSEAPPGLSRRRGLRDISNTPLVPHGSPVLKKPRFGTPGPSYAGAIPIATPPPSKKQKVAFGYNGSREKRSAQGGYEASADPSRDCGGGKAGTRQHYAGTPGPSYALQGDKNVNSKRERITTPGPSYTSRQAVDASAKERITTPGPSYAFSQGDENFKGDCEQAVMIQRPNAVSTPGPTYFESNARQKFRDVIIRSAQKADLRYGQHDSHQDAKKTENFGFACDHAASRVPLLEQAVPDKECVREQEAAATPCWGRSVSSSSNKSHNDQHKIADFSGDGQQQHDRRPVGSSRVLASPMFGVMKTPKVEVFDPVFGDLHRDQRYQDQQDERGGAGSGKMSGKASPCSVVPEDDELLQAMSPIEKMRFGDRVVLAKGGGQGEKHEVVIRAERGAKVSSSPPTFALLDLQRREQGKQQQDLPSFGGISSKQKRTPVFGGSQPSASSGSFSVRGQEDPQPSGGAFAPLLQPQQSVEKRPAAAAAAAAASTSTSNDEVMSSRLAEVFPEDYAASSKSAGEVPPIEDFADGRTEEQKRDDAIGRPLIPEFRTPTLREVMVSRVSLIRNGPPPPAEGRKDDDQVEVGTSQSSMNNGNDRRDLVTAGPASPAQILHGSTSASLSHFHDVMKTPDLKVASPRFHQENLNYSDDLGSDSLAEMEFAQPRLVPAPLPF
ncbi:unnamed protein product [Amoebophrya sp. A25]|nr:unnamed protein product [Amoebophrya sp. A25]|eukprot:GSA25T00009771001.1